MVTSSAEVAVVVRGTERVVRSTGTWLSSVVTAPSVDTGGTRISGLVGGHCFSGVVWTAPAPGVKTAVLDRALGLVTGG